MVLTFSEHMAQSSAEYQNISGHTSEGNAGSLELHVPAEDPKSKHAEIDIIIPVRKVSS